MATTEAESATGPGKTPAWPWSFDRKKRIVSFGSRRSDRLSPLQTSIFGELEDAFSDGRSAPPLVLAGALGRKASTIRDAVSKMRKTFAATLPMITIEDGYRIVYTPEPQTRR
jgi:hypothetical protein